VNEETKKETASVQQEEASDVNEDDVLIAETENEVPPGTSELSCIKKFDCACSYSNLVIVEVLTVCYYAESEQNSHIYVDVNISGKAPTTAAGHP
jgi:hypothetical protein